METRGDARRRAGPHASKRRRDGLAAAAARSRRMAAAFGIVALLGVAEGCAALDPNHHANAIASAAGLSRERVRTDRFVLTAFARIERPDRPLRIYIEGDGLAWITRTEPSQDPTPRVAMGLELAAADPAANVVYLARPCQFTPMRMNPACNVRDWTGGRFSSGIVRSIDEAISQFAARVPGQPLDLVGYSGGGAIAVLVAARRHDVRSIRTVAGNLDDEFVNRLHRVSPMPESENAIDFASRVATIPQIHFSGAGDTVVPALVARRFVAAAGARCARARIVPDIGHDGDWARSWPALLNELPTCG